MDPQAKKLALRAINYGLYVLTARDGEQLGAASVNWLSQASFEPPLIMVAGKNDNDTTQLIAKTGNMAVNVVGDQQLDLAKAFFRTTKVEDGKLSGYSWEPGPATGCPLLVDLANWFEARVTDTVERGDHTVFVAEVIEAGVREEGVTPLLLRSTGMNYGG